MSKIELRVSNKGQKAVDILRKQGFRLDSTLEIEVPSLPADVTELGDEDLMLLYNRFTQYYDFLCAQVACAQIDERDLEKTLELEESRCLLDKPAVKSERVAILKAQVASDPAICDLTETYTEAYNYRKLIEMMASNADRDIYLLSRELTRRTAGANHYQNRRNKWEI
mgnify:CR=1 FL=1